MNKIFLILSIILILTGIFLPESSEGQERQALKLSEQLSVFRPLSVQPG